MSCFIDFIDINLWEDKVREIHLDKSRLRNSCSGISQKSMGCSSMSIMWMTAIRAATSIVPRSSA